MPFSGKVKKPLVLPSWAFSAKSRDSIFLKMAKTFKNGHFLHNYANYAKMGFFLENRALSVFLHFWNITPCQISEKTNDRKYENFGDGLTIYPESNSTEVENTYISSFWPFWINFDVIFKGEGVEISKNPEKFSMEIF